ncbi:fatty acid desaturase [filamentous cyanobacterium LEGE 11480]|uniref:Fatty acid desaturase n=1 Tax=Romeriopsis navalis LEGE 11480 TaxID=2777977 RepID=A0A928Z385_9CYAN|nr:fatty acid desaturase [Romeriopsis navalis]MBE9029792.1 fatty acid desaturase [Romeriopsis navalis LEGE 11480]
MHVIDRESLKSQATYAKELRSKLPPEAFQPSINKLWILLINVVILILGWGIAGHLNQWNHAALWLYLPLALVMGNSVVVLLFSSHDLMHSKTIQQPVLRQTISLIGLTLLWMPPTLWKAVHNRVHHNNTNALHDPDRNYLHSQPNNFGKWIQNLFAPSADANPFWIGFGMGYSWGVYAFRNIASALVFDGKANPFSVDPVKVSPKERKAIALELGLMVVLHGSIIAYLSASPINLILGYFLPIWLGYAGVIFYIYTNHLLCPMSDVNDPLYNSVSLRVPKIFDTLHFNFSYHTEHHLFPGLNSDYYPMVQALLIQHYPEQFNLLDAGQAWRLMLQTPRHYKDANTFTNWNGQKNVPSPLSPSEKGTY